RGSDATRRSGPPAALILGPGDCGVGSRADDRAHLELPVRLHGRLAAAAFGLAPHDLDLRADLKVGVDGAERQRRAFVLAVPGPHRQTDLRTAVVDDAVEVEVTVVGERQ